MGIAAAATKALEWDVFVPHEKIEVMEVRGDTAVLKGRVLSWTERNEAERAAWSSPGIAAVDNQIVVRP